MTYPPLLTIKQVAAHFKKHQMTIYRWAKNKKIPMFMVGGRWRARSEDIFTKKEHWNGCIPK